MSSALATLPCCLVIHAASHLPNMRCPLQILRSMAWMSSTVEGAVTEAKARRRKEREQRREQRRRELREMRTAGRHKLEAIVLDEDEGEQEEEEEEEDTGRSSSSREECCSMGRAATRLSRGGRCQNVTAIMT